MNVVALSGRAIDVPGIRYTTSGKAVTKGTLAVRRKFKNEQGKYDADFIDFVCWGKLAELIANNVKKGDVFSISGEWQTRIWEKDDGSKQKVSELNITQFDFPERKSQNQEQGQSNDSNPY